MYTYSTVHTHTQLTNAHSGFSEPMKRTQQNEQQLLRFLTGRRQTSWLFTSAKIWFYQRSKLATVQRF